MTDQIVELGAVDLSAKTVIIHAWDLSSAALADIAAASGTKIHFNLVLSNSGTLPVRGT
jgi:ribosomal protein L18E